MADPISIVGTAAGIVSLGLQVIQGVKKYVDRLNSRDERVAKTLAHLRDLKTALGVIEDSTQSLRHQHQAPADAVVSCLHACKTEMQVLQEKLQDVGPSQHTSVKGKMKEIQKKLEYPLQISALEEIERSLGRILAQLSLGIQGLGLHSHMKISTGIDALSDAANSQAVTLARVSADTDRIAKINTANVSQLAGISSSLQPLRPMLHSLESVTAASFSKLETQTLINYSATTDSLDTLKSQAEAHTKMMNEILNILRPVRDQPLLSNQESMGRYLVGSLVSKPSLLRDMHESSDLQRGVRATSHDRASISDRSTMDSLDLVPSNAGLCGCRSWRRVKRSTSRWYPFGFFSNEESVSRHRPSCPKYTDISSQRQRTVGVTYIGLRRLLAVAVSVSLSLEYGAGGTSISPMFRYFYMVDTFKSPTFRMMSILPCSIMMLDRNSVGNQKWRKCGRTIVADCMSWISTAYSKQVASPGDVTSNNLTLIDYLNLLFEYVADDYDQEQVYLAVSTLFDFGVTSTLADIRPPPPDTMSRADYQSWPDKNTWDLFLLLWDRSPGFSSLWQPDMCNFIECRELIIQSDKISTAVEFALDPLCTVFLYQDLDGLLKLLATKLKYISQPRHYSHMRSFIELAPLWPVGLAHVLKTEPGFFGSAETEDLFESAARHSSRICRKGARHMCDDCGCSECIEILLGHSCALTSLTLRNITWARHASFKGLYAVLQHLKFWRQKLQEVFRLYFPRARPIADEASLLDYKAPYAVDKLRAIGVDPHKMFGFQENDYRLGSSLPGYVPIYFILSTGLDAQVAFNMGFRDVDVSCGVATPLSRASNLEYSVWLIDHGADYTRQQIWAVARKVQSPYVVNRPKHSIAHWMFQFFFRRPSGLEPIALSIVKSSYFSHFMKTSYYDGCVCACLSTPKGCSPFAIYVNSVVVDSYESRESTRDVFKGMLPVVYAFASGFEQLPTLVECVVRYFAFYAFEIRHTCCGSLRRYASSLPSDYGSGFDELREEDENRIHRLNELVTDVMAQYNESTLSLVDFMDWFLEYMDRVREGEKEKAWTAAEKDALLSIGVVPRDSAADVDKPGVSEPIDIDNKLIDPAYINRQFEIIVNGGRSEVEDYIKDFITPSLR
ncbi:hypothetical protein F4802DRAFT_560167 [Xylaria palmicola]|nr:hypothetical protein F4802DRAFT_560167 [Xylaria palmicola]